MTGFELAILLAMLGGTAASVGGTLYANKKNQQLNSQRFLQSTELANTAHQREVYDLRAAGLNPILSTGTAGAAVPNVASAEVSSPTASLENIGKGIGNFMNSSASTRAQVGLNNSLSSLNVQRGEALQGDIAIQKALKDAVDDDEVKAALKDELLLRGAPKNEYEASYLGVRKYKDTLLDKWRQWRENGGFGGPKSDKPTKKISDEERYRAELKRKAKEDEAKERQRKAAEDDKKVREKQKKSSSFRHRSRGY